MKGSGKGTIPEKEKTVFWYILAALLLSSMFAMHAVFGKNQAMDRLEEPELVELKKAYEVRAAKKFPSAPQLRRKDAAERSDETVFLV